MTAEKIKKALRLSGGLKIEGNLKRVSEFTEALVFVDDAIDKQIPNSKANIYDDQGITCGNCDSDIDEEDYNYCPYCGQRLDWSCID